MKVGVTIQRYVSFRNARPWVTHAYKNVKGRGVRQTSQVDDSFDADSQSLQESLSNPLGYRNTGAPTPGPAGDATSAPRTVGNLSSLAASDQSVVSELTSDRKGQPSSSDKETSKSMSTKGNNSDQQIAEETGDESDLATNVQGKGDQSGEGSSKTRPEAVPERPKRCRERKKSTSDVGGPSTPQPTSTYQRVRLLCSPWRKPEGSINKHVFKTMMESMMLKIMASPGISLQTLCENYTPYNQPFLKLQLLEILEDLKAIEKTVIRRQNKTTLFSKRVRPKLATVQKEEDTVVYFPTKMCITRLGQFLVYVNGH
ncbi:general transcription factor 3C polypeptide 1-like [Mizuhopecten yessoensis]|uniref:General transcription factor 3C polypeptide 1 n=1 Tax=Mizuhopecten yessoensis TaxID=6573 RepID=A0A210Q1A8_MIZYE|nr:general transcription factor 3C polypeptide 1-like [Mizuhopecten yessoensis]OWF42516.1 General transcription factor 3C polypeptide 1 [Mizuhopecten yessoensis]